MTEPCNISVHSFEHKLCDTNINYQVTKLSGQTMIWVGSGEPTLSSLSVAVPTKDFPSTQIIGSGEQSSMLSSRLSKKLNKQVFVSYNVPDDNILTPLIIEKLVAEIKKCPEKF